MSRRRKKQSSLPFLLLIAVLAGGAAWYWFFYRAQPSEADGAPGETSRAGAALTDPNAEAADPSDPDAVEDGPEPVVEPFDPVEELDELLPRTDLSAAEAGAAYERGLALAGDADATDAEVIEARTLLSKAYFSGKLNAPSEARARTALTALADKTLLSGKVYDTDPYARDYIIQPNDTLGKIERTLRLRAPIDLLYRINGSLSPVRDIFPNQRIKVIQGPFHAVVRKSEFVMDVYLLTRDRPITFVRRFSVGLGKEDATPEGSFRVRRGKKLKQAPWDPPPGSGQTGKILWGRPGYPLGTDGYWIGLEGVADETRIRIGYGIHGTNEPESVGRAQSLGCMRMRDEDIGWVFAMLYEVWSTVHIEP